MVYMLSASYVLYYYQDICGVNAIAMGIILMAARVFDAFNDPIMDIPYWSMIPAFTEGGKEREILTTLARSAAGVGSALITLLTMTLFPVAGLLAAVWIFHQKYLLTDEKVEEPAAEIRARKRNSNTR